MGLTSLFFLGIVPQLIASRVLHARQSVSCDFEVAANSGDTCTSFASSWGLSEKAFVALNPSVTCPGNLVAGQDYCVIGTVTTLTSTSTSTSTAESTAVSSTTVKVTSTSSSKVTTNPASTTTSSSPYSPTQSGLASNCNNFHLVSSGDTCSGIESQYGISAGDFASWNPSIDSTCDNLWLGYYVCVGVPGASTITTTSTAPATTTSSGPSPQMPSIVSNCNKYYQIQSGDGCWSIEQAESITSDNFLAWNPYVDANCDNLWLGYYVCVGVSGTTATTKPTSTITTTATATGPSPQMPSIVSNCNKFYQVQSGDGCWSIEQSQSITSADFQAWNPYVDANCDNLWLGYYVCVGV